MVAGRWWLKPDKWGHCRQVVFLDRNDPSSKLLLAWRNEVKWWRYLNKTAGRTPWVTHTCVVHYRTVFNGHIEKLKLPVIMCDIENCKIIQMWHIFMTYWINGHSRQVQLVIRLNFGWSLVTGGYPRQVQISGNCFGGTLDRSLKTGGHCRHGLLYRKIKL